MTLEADLFALESQLLKTGEIGAYLAQIDAIQTMIVTGTGDPRAAIANLTHVPFEPAASAAVSDAYTAGQASAHELINDPAIVAKTAKGKPPKIAASDIAGLDKEGATALAKSQKLAALGQDIQAAASPLIAHANTLRRTATTTVVNSGNAGVVDVGTAANMPMVWVAETDACVHCLAYSGQVVTAGDEFPSGLTYGKTPLAPRGQLVAPPLHPYCRCHLEILLDAGYAEALRREADRSVLRGFSLESESMSTRVDAANRLLEKGVDAPKSVIAYSTKSVKAGKFTTRGRPADPIPPTKPQTPSPKPPTPPKAPPFASSVVSVKTIESVSATARATSVANGDWRYIADRGQRAAVLLQNDYRAEHAVKSVAQNLSDGKSAFDGVGVNREWLKPYLGPEGPGNVRFVEADARSAIEDAARWLNEQKTVQAKTLYKGLDVPQGRIKKLFTVGNDFDLSSSSFTPDEVIARKYSSRRQQQQVIVRVTNTKAVKLGRNPSDGNWKETNEHLVSGRGKVTKVVDDGRTVYVDVTIE